MQSLQIIFQDNNLLVIDKPAGIVVTNEGIEPGVTISDILQTDFGIALDRGGVVHRLDKDTSGLLIIGKTQQSLENLKKQFSERQIKKEYLTLVHGLVKEKGKVEAAILRNPKNRLKFDVFSEGRESSTKYQPEKNLKMPEENVNSIFQSLPKHEIKKLRTPNYELFTLLRCFPLTGRTHQIRVHLKYINHPIVGDNKYGGRKNLKYDKLWCPRQFLHAEKITFTHPITNEIMKFESPLPEDLKKVLSFLEIRN